MNGRFEHRSLPLPLENLELSIRNKNGDIVIDKATARIGTGSVSMTMDLPKEPVCAPGTVPLSMPTVKDASPNDNSLGQEVNKVMEFQDRLRDLQVSVTNFTISPELFLSIPGKARIVKDGNLITAGGECAQHNQNQSEDAGSQICHFHV